MASPAQAQLDVEYSTTSMTREEIYMILADVTPPPSPPSPAVEEELAMDEEEPVMDQEELVMDQEGLAMDKEEIVMANGG